MTIPVPSGARVWLATGRTDMRKGFDGLAVLVQETLERNPHNGNLSCSVAARRADQGSMARRPGHVPVFQASGAQPLDLAVACGWNGSDHAAQPGNLLEGIDWRLPQHTWRPEAAG